MTVARGYLMGFGMIWTVIGSSAIGGVVFLVLARILGSVWKDINAILTTAKLVFIKKR